MWFRRRARSSQPIASTPPPRLGGQTADLPVRAQITESTPCQKALRLHVRPEAMRPVREAVLTELQRRSVLPGFRRGKAPVALVERQYAQTIREETMRRVTQQALEQAAKDHDLKPVGPFQVTATDFNETEGLRFEASVEVEPSFALGAYHGIPLQPPSTEVLPQEVEKALAALQESMAQLVPSGQGETKERHLPPVDDELAKDMGFERLQQLKEHVEAKLREQKRVARAEALEAAVCQALLERHTFEVPPRLVGHQTERLTRDFTVRLLLSGVSEPQVQEQVTTFTEQLRTSAQQQVKLTFILDRIATQEALTVTEHELLGRLWQVSQRWKKDPAEVRKIFDDKGLWPSVLGAVRREKTIALVIAAAAIGDGPAEPLSPLERPTEISRSEIDQRRE